MKSAKSNSETHEKPAWCLLARESSIYFPSITYVHTPIHAAPATAWTGVKAVIMGAADDSRRAGASS
jgi:hypothetical protein